MKVSETVLTFVVAPAAIMLVIAGLVYAGGTRQSKRYRPGRPFDFAPVWFLSAPEQLAGHPAARAAGGPPALPAGAGNAARIAEDAHTGGASDRW